MSDPRKPTGQSDEARHARWLHEKAANQSRLGRVAGHRVANTTLGPMVVASNNGGTPGATVEPYVLAMPTAERPTVVGDDWIIVRDYDAAAFDGGTKIPDEDGAVTGIGSTDIYVAKQYKHRCSKTTERVLGTVYLYTYTEDASEPNTPPDYRQNKIREVEDEDSNFEEQRIVPPWVASRIAATGEPDEGEFVPGDIIYAIETTGTGVFRTVGEGEDATEEELTLLDCCSSRQWARTWSTTFEVP